MACALIAPEAVAKRDSVGFSKCKTDEIILAKVLTDDKLNGLGESDGVPAAEAGTCFRCGESAMMFTTATAMWLFWGGFVFLCVFNFLPAAIAYVNQHPDKHLLAILNIVSLFSFALWIALMAWATAGRNDHPLIQRFVGTPQKRTRLVVSVTALVVASFAGTVWTVARA